MEMNKRTGIVFLILTLLFSSHSVYAKETTEIESKIQETVEALETITKGQEAVPGNSLDDWKMLALALSGKAGPYEQYLKGLEEYVADCYRKEGGLDPVKGTEYHRTILVIIGLGGDPLSLQGDEEINLVKDGIYDFSGGDLKLQGTNGLIYGLLALDAKAYEVPEGAAYDRQRIIEELLASQSPDGGFAFQGNGSGDVDITAMALQALAPYTQQPEVKEAVEKACSWLADVQKQVDSCETAAQMVMAYSALGLDVQESGILDSMEQYRLPGGAYCHQKGETEEDLIATYQALLALETVEKQQKEGEFLYDFCEYKGPNIEENSRGNPGILIVALGIAGVCIVSILSKLEKTPT